MMEKRTKTTLTILHVLSWIIFLGLCIKTGSLIYSFFVSLAINPEGAKNLHLGLNLSGLYAYSIWQYITIVSYIIFLSAFKAYIFYLAIRIFVKINLVHPFSQEISAIISKIGTVALGVGLLSLFANIIIERLAKKGVLFPSLQDYLGGAGEFLMMAAIVFIIAQIYKRGIEIQSENELTV